MSLLVAGLLGFGDTAFRSSVSAKDLRAKDASAQAAVDATISGIRGNLDRGIEGDTGCGSAVANLNGFSSVSVACAPRAGSGGGNDRLPKNAVLTLSTDPLEGILLDKNNTLSIAGAIYSHSSIRLVGAASPFSILDIGGNITAETGGDCANPNIRISSGSPGVKRCSGATPNGADPNYPAVTTASAFSVDITTATCSVRGSYELATFQPGRYVTSPTALANTACGGAADGMLFPPGAYYFLNVPWEAQGLDIVAGTPGSWFSSPTGTPPSKLDGGCAVGQPGAQFIMGGTSYLSIGNETRGAGVPTTFNICASPNSSGPSIAMYGVKDVSQGFVPQSGPVTFGPYLAVPTGAAVATGPRATLFSDDKPYAFVHGTLYTPLSALDLDLHNTTQEFFDRGVIARSLLFHVSASSTQDTSPISLPTCAATPGDCRRDRSVVLTASINGKPVLRVLANLADGNGAVPGASVATPAWSVLR